jgi:signal transduction histidine kinase
MLELAANPLAGSIRDSHRRDELGDMARAANVFVTEIGNRERALRQAKEQADTALEELRQTQADLIQAEKLASLGQLVAGVAHEINTPVGIALTTATLLGDDVKRVESAVSEGRLAKTEFRRFVERMTEGSRLLFTNLSRAADLVHSFKQVAADQASGERRSFAMEAWLRELMVSLGPVLRKTTHEVTISCPPDLTIDTYPGALAQVLTNLVMNAVAHAYDEGQSGHLSLSVAERPEGLRIMFTDDGKGIACTDHAKVFEPFYTTRRNRGSTGLGLHIVYNLVTSKLQGRIDIESMPGTGTSFIIDLPRSVTDLAADRPAALVQG